MNISVAPNNFPFSDLPETKRNEPARHGAGNQPSFARLVGLSDQQANNAKVETAAGPQSLRQMRSPLEPPYSGTHLARAAVTSPPDQNEAVYAAEVRIGDDAVGFAARPVVGPAAVGHQTTHTESASHKTSPRIDVAEPAWVSGDEAVDDPSDRGRSNSVALTAAGSLHPSLQHLATVPNDLRLYDLPQFSTRTTPAIASAQSLPNLRIMQVPGTSGRDHLANRAIPQARTPFQASTSPLVQILADPAEYRLLIRTQKLGANERAYIATEITSTLMHLGLAPLPVRTVHPDGGT